MRAVHPHYSVFCKFRGIFDITVIEGLALLALVGWDQGCYTSFHAWDSPTQQRISMTTPHNFQKSCQTFMWGKSLFIMISLTPNSIFQIITKSFVIGLHWLFQECKLLLKLREDSNFIQSLSKIFLKICHSVILLLYLSHQYKPHIGLQLKFSPSQWFYIRSEHLTTSLCFLLSLGP